MKSKILLLLLSLVLGCNGDKADKADKAATGKARTKNEKIEYLLESTGILKIGSQVASAMFNQFKSSWAMKGETVDEKAAALFQKKFLEEMNQELAPGTEFVNSLIEIYSKHYSEKNIDDMLAFYNSETGKKVIEEMPATVAEGMAVGARWGKEKGLKIAEQVLMEVRSEGYRMPDI